MPAAQAQRISLLLRRHVPPTGSAGANAADEDTSATNAKIVACTKVSRTMAIKVDNDNDIVILELTADDDRERRMELTADDDDY